MPTWIVSLNGKGQLAPIRRFPLVALLVLLNGCHEPTLEECDHSIYPAGCRRLELKNIERHNAAANAAVAREAERQRLEGWLQTLTPDQRFQWQLEQQREAFEAQENRKLRRALYQPITCNTIGSSVTCY